MARDIVIQVEKCFEAEIKLLISMVTSSTPVNYEHYQAIRDQLETGRLRLLEACQEYIDRCKELDYGGVLQ